MNIRVVIDVEMCGVNGEYTDYPYKNEIIQIGAVKMDDQFEILDDFSTFVCPRYGKITCFIEKLTGITQRDVNDAPDLSVALKKMRSWIGDCDVIFYAWSGVDQSQIRKEIIVKKLNEAEMDIFLDKNRWEDYQKTVGDRFKIKKKLNLKEALDLTDLDLTGRLHDGLFDSYNTAQLISKLELHPEFQPVMEKLRIADGMESPKLSISLGNLLAGIELKSA
ncbi:MAG: exonuclease domain-containing protein [Parasporobacterium sp.]|nr:exonuclease domain-containing protein [Parasporobacterium sp.]